MVQKNCTYEVHNNYPAKYDELNLITISDYNKKFGVILVIVIIQKIILLP